MYGLKPVPFKLKPIPFKLKPIPFKLKPAPFKLKPIPFKLTNYQNINAVHLRTRTPGRAKSHPLLDLRKRAGASSE
jgi:hypothetical protein